MVHDQIKKGPRPHAGIEEEFQIVAVGSVQARFAKQKAVTDENDSFVISRKRIT